MAGKREERLAQLREQLENAQAGLRAMTETLAIMTETQQGRDYPEARAAYWQRECDRIEREMESLSW